MAKTTFATGNALTKKAWEEKLFRDTAKESYFMPRFSGEGSESVVQTKRQLEKKKGDTIYFGIVMRLAGSGVTSGQTLEGNEEKLTDYNDNVTLERYRHAVRDDGQLTRQRAMFDIPMVSREKLQVWGAEKIDKLCFNALQASPTSFFHTASGTLTRGTSDPSASITATDLLTPGLISKVRAWCLTGGNRGQTPIRPIRIMGKKYFVLLVHPDVMNDLKNDATFAQARREALERGKDNPIFSGAEAIWDGVVVHEHENVAIATTWGGASVAGSKNVLLGAQALCWAWGERPSLVQEEFDYQEEMGYAWRMTCGVTAPTFNSKVYGSVAVWTSRTNIAGL